VSRARFPSSSYMNSHMSCISGFGSRFGVEGLSLWVSNFGFRVSGFGLRVSGFGLRVSGFGFRASGFGLRVSGSGLTPAFWFKDSEFKAQGAGC